MTHTGALCATIVASLLAAGPARAQVVKCVDAQGRVEYARICPPGTSESGRVRESAPAPAAPAPTARMPASSPASPARAEPTPDVLDGAEMNVCRAAGGLAQARRALDDITSGKEAPLPVESLAGPQNDPRRRAFLQQKLDEGLVSGQRSIVDSQAKDLARYQAEYRRLTGAEYDTALCGDTQRRLRRREAWEASRREEDRQARAQKVVANEADAVRAICREKQAMDGPSQDVAHHFPPDHLKQIQQEGREAYGRLVSAYERSHGKRFDPAHCTAAARR